MARSLRNRNNRLFKLARSSYGGVRYPIGTMDFTQADWQQHYGPLWPTFVARKQQFDPAGIQSGFFPPDRSPRDPGIRTFS